MKFLKFIALVSISIGAFSTIDNSLADNKNPENYKVLSIRMINFLLSMSKIFLIVEMNL